MAAGISIKYDQLKAVKLYVDKEASYRYPSHIKDGKMGWRILWRRNYLLPEQVQISGKRT